MKTFVCRDAGLNCDFTARGNSSERVYKKIMRHLQEDHPDRAERMMDEMSPREIKEILMPLIREEDDFDDDVY